MLIDISKFPTDMFIRNNMFINFREIFHPTCLFHPTHLLGTPEYTVDPTSNCWMSREGRGQRIEKLG